MIKMLRSWSDLVKKQRLEVKEWRKDYKWQLILYYMIWFVIGILSILAYAYKPWNLIKSKFETMHYKMKNVFKKDSEMES